MLLFDEMDLSLGLLGSRAFKDWLLLGVGPACAVGLESLNVAFSAFRLGGADGSLEGWDCEDSVGGPLEGDTVVLSPDDDELEVAVLGGST